MATKLGIVIDLDDLKSLMDEYVAEELSDDHSDNLLRQMYLGHFLLWLTNKQRKVEESNGKA